MDNVLLLIASASSTLAHHSTDLAHTYTIASIHVYMYVAMYAE